MEAEAEDDGLLPQDEDGARPPPSQRREGVVEGKEARGDDSDEAREARMGRQCVSLHSVRSLHSHQYLHQY